METSVKVDFSGKGIPCIWESGGATKQNGTATLVADSRGEPKMPFVFRSELNGNHALIPTVPGDHVITVVKTKNDFEILVMEITAYEADRAVCRVLHTYNGAVWDRPLPAYLAKAVTMARKKASTKHCFRALFYKERDRKSGDIL